MKKLFLISLLTMLMIFPAMAASIQVSVPAAGATWKIGSTQTVQWTFSGIPDSAKVHVFLFRDGTKVGKIADTIDIGANGQGSCSWNVGVLLNAAQVVEGTGYVVRVRMADDTTAGESGIFSLSSGSTGPQVFQPKSGVPLMNKKTMPVIPDVADVQLKTIQVSEPKAGAVLSPTGSADVLWNFVNIPAANVSISLRRNGQPDVVLAANHGSIGPFHWDLNALNPDPGTCKIAVETLDKAHRGLSGAFTIKEQGEIVPVFPIQGNQFYQHTSLDVQWKRVGNLQLVDLTLRKNGSDWAQTLANGVAAKLEKQNIVLGDLEIGEYRIEFKYAGEGGFNYATSGSFTIQSH